ncbi:DNA topoisomerase 2-alpha-like isoform X2 [Amphibalanus amphitrite]|nr:DNA topoisomerase 2-alpha-like isoform X2 [Amphibalanus amphitrite]
MFSNMAAAVNGAANGETAGGGGGDKAAAAKAAKRLSVERIYQKKSQLEHILLRPDTYIGSCEPLTETMYVYDDEQGMHQREITFVPGLFKIFDEVLVNAADNKQRDPNMDTIKIEIDSENNSISIYNNGKGIPVVTHKDEKMYVPTMIFGHLLTSSNFNDEEQKVTGGRNGYGAKLCNIFSTKFTVETASIDYKRSFKQTWANNMSKTSEPKVKDFHGSDFTKVTFSPDLDKFKMTCLDKDTVALLSRRAYDVAASTRGVKVFLNGKRVPVKNFKDYVELYLKDKVDDTGNQIKCVYENCGPRWEVAVAISDKGFQQVSFVNSIATTKGGRHVDHVADMIIKQLIETLKKKNKGGVQIKPFQIKNHMWVFINCLIVNPAFDSQTKENMILQVKSFGSKCTLSDKFIGQVNKCGIVESVMAWAKFKAQSQLNTKCNSKKQNKIRGIPKLEDANDAGTRYSQDCTLILTEGDSAKTLAVSGLGVVGRDRYGVFPLKGKLLNVREASHKQILENAEINNVIKIMGLQYKKTYDNAEDLKTLRYGKLMIMTDQDQDGSHIKGLLINFIHHNWPTLLRQPFLEQFITPIVKATKGKEEVSFFSIPEFEEWKQNKSNWHTYKIKYYKGLGTSTAKEAKEYFSDMSRHRIKFRYEGDAANRAINMAFSKKCVDQRKEWLTNWMEECKRRRELGLPELYLYEKDTRAVNFTDFVNKELVLFSNLDNERSIPSLVDGLKPGQRKVLFTCLKRNDKREIKVAQLVGSVAEMSAYHHGEMSLASTIINMAQNFVGSNNINLLLPVGQFGTRLQGGKDAASPRYIFTMLSPVTRAIFSASDLPLLKHQMDDNQRIEPEWYIPILPMILVNGADGIGTGWMTKIPNYNPREIVENLRRMMRGDDPQPMKPWFKNFRGEILEASPQHYIMSGEISVLSPTQVEITELPVKTWTQPYKEFLSQLLNPEKGNPMISDFKEYTTDTTVKFIVSMPEEKLIEAEEKGLHTVFKLQTSFSNTSMVLFDHMGVLRKYDNVASILREFYTLRLEFYDKRKTHLEGLLGAESSRLSNQARFILEKCDNKLTIENKKKKDMIAELVKRGYDSDPVKAWKVAQQQLLDEEAADSQDSQEEEAAAPGAPDFDYLLGMNMWMLTKEKKDELLKKRDEKLQELKVLKSKSPSDLWTEDLDAFIEALDAQEQKEREDDDAGSKKAKAKGKVAGASRKTAVVEYLPSPSARRVAPVVTADVKKRLEAAQNKKDGVVRGRKRKSDDGTAEDGDDKPKRQKKEGDGEDKPKKKREPKGKDGMKQTKLQFKKKPGKEAWETDSEEEDFRGSDSEPEVSSPTRVREGGRRAAAAKVKYNFNSDEEDASSGDEELFDNDAVKEPDHVVEVDSDLDTSAVQPAPKPARENKAKATLVISDTDSEFEGAQKKKKPAAKKNDESASDMFDSMMSAGREEPDADSDAASVRSHGSAAASKAKPKPAAAAKKPAAAAKKPAAAAKKPTVKRAPKKKTTYDSDSDGDFASSKPKSKSKKKKKASSDSDSDASAGYVPLAQRAAGRARKVTSYKVDESSDDD